MDSRMLVGIYLVIGIFGHGYGEINPKSWKQSVEDANLKGDYKENKETAMNRDCIKSYSMTCLKLDVVSFVDKISEQQNLGLFPGISVIKENNTANVPASELVANLARDFPNDVEKRLDAFLVHKIGTYLNSHSISIKLFDAKTLEDARNLNQEVKSFGIFGTDSETDTGRGKKDKGGMSTLTAGLMMMKGTLGALGFGALAMLAGKALMTGLMALMLSAIVGLKSLTSSSEKKTTYEVIAKPVYTNTHSHSSEEHHAGHGYGHSGYGRSIDLSDSLVQESIQKYGNPRNRRGV
ncbi:uncharacterized protein LOC130677973 [Microplitis mediator]|uniref:uncharacterized protein LOC130677973 n=1 Tax=Microplitis mediator TaxID=375433 RepID=UPI0025569D55|nr:uncharacterized protein LOC130677973 [Microplitis mediator]